MHPVTVGALQNASETSRALANTLKLGRKIQYDNMFPGISRLTRNHTLKKKRSEQCYLKL